MMALIDLSDRADAGHRVFIAQMTAKCVARIGGIYDDAAITDNGDSLPDQAQVRCVGMNRKKLSHSKTLFELNDE